MGSKPKREIPQPWQEVPHDDDDIRAFRALAAGNASDTQQKRALRWVIEQASGYYDLSFRPGADGDRLTTFAEGKRFVGAQVVKLTKLTPKS